MTRTSIIGSVLFCAMIGLGPVVGQQVEDNKANTGAATESKRSSFLAKIPVFDFGKACREHDGDRTPDNLIACPVPNIVIEEEEERMIVGPIGNPSDDLTNEISDRSGCEHGCWITMPQDEEGSTCPDCPSCTAGRTCERPMPETLSLSVAGVAGAKPTFTNIFAAEPAPAASPVTTEPDCDELAKSLASSLADSDISSESRQAILATTMKLLVRNAELEARAEIATLKLEQERELARLRSEVVQLRTYANQIGEVKNWMGPLYTNQNQTQQQFQSLMADLQITNRTLRLLEQEKQGRQLQLTQPRNLPQPTYAPQRETNPYAPRPERWSRLPSYTPSERPSRPDHSTSNESQRESYNFRANAPAPQAPRRLNPQEVQEERLRSEIKQAQTQLNRMKSDSNVRQASWVESGWKEPLPSNPLKPMPQMLRPAPTYPSH